MDAALHPTPAPPQTPDQERGTWHLAPPVRLDALPNGTWFRYQGRRWIRLWAKEYASTKTNYSGQVYCREAKTYRAVPLPASAQVREVILED